MNNNKIYFNSDNSITELCKLGSIFEADKSPYNLGKWKHAYTPFYDMIFSPMRNKNINFGEIGIFKNASMHMWRKYFSSANLYGWDYNESFLEYAKLDNLENVFYDHINVREEDSINDSFQKCGVKFDVIIDDASHDLWDQIKVIRNVYKYLNPGAYLIIEDIDRDRDENEYLNHIEFYHHNFYFSHISFVETEHKNKMTEPYDNDKLLVMVRNNLV